MKRKPTTVVLIFDENSVLNLYIRLTSMRPFLFVQREKLPSYYKENSQECLQRKTSMLFAKPFHCGAQMYACI